MSLNEIINKLKLPKEEMSAISFNIPLSLKKQIADIAKENGFTMNAFLVTMIDNVLNGELKEKTNLEIVNKLESLLSMEKDIEQQLEDIENDFRLQMEKSPNYKPTDNDIMEGLLEDLERVQYMINVLKS